MLGRQRHPQHLGPQQWTMELDVGGKPSTRFPPEWLVRLAANSETIKIVTQYMHDNKNPLWFYPSCDQNYKLYNLKTYDQYTIKNVRKIPRRPRRVPGTIETSFVKICFNKFSLFLQEIFVIIFKFPSTRSRYFLNFREQFAMSFQTFFVRTFHGK